MFFKLAHIVLILYPFIKKEEMFTIIVGGNPIHPCGVDVADGVVGAVGVGALVGVALGQGVGGGVGLVVGLDGADGGVRGLLGHAAMAACGHGQHQRHHGGHHGQYVPATVNSSCKGMQVPCLPWRNEERTMPTRRHLSTKGGRKDLGRMEARQNACACTHGTKKILDSTSGIA